MVAEQYIYEPVCQAQLKLIKKGLIGEPSFLHLSMAHEYHGASLMRAYLGVNVSTAFTVSVKAYAFPTVETMTRYERITDGRVANKKRTIGTFEFTDGKVAIYEFDGEQYRSPIRNNYVKLQGVRGEMKDNVFCWLDEQNEPRKVQLISSEVQFSRDSDNPNLKFGSECEKIMLVQDGAEDEVVYEAPFGLCGISKEETAVAMLMLQAAEYDREAATQALRDTLQDAYMAILMKQAEKNGESVASRMQSWHEE